MARRAPLATRPRRRGSEARPKRRSSSSVRDGLERLVTSISDPVGTEDAPLIDIEEFYLDLRGSKQTPRLATPPRWVPPWRTDLRPQGPQVSLKPLSPVKTSRPRLSLRSKEGDDMLSSVLNTILPAAPSKPSHLKELSPICPLSPASAHSPKSSSVEVLEFTGLLIRRFGTVKRAFRALKQAAAATRSLSEVSGDVLSKQEFMWCVTSFLNHGDQTLALHLLAELKAGEELSLSDLERDFGDTLISLPELRRQLLEEFTAEELQEILCDGREPKSARKAKREFQKLIKPLGIEACQAQHLFEVTGGAASDVREALCGGEAFLWKDLRLRLVRRFGSVAAALALEDTSFEELPCGDVAACLRAAAPETSLEDFWQRLAAEWPQLLPAARRRRLGEALHPLLEHFPEDFAVLYLDKKSFQALCAPLDVSEEDAKRLFEQITESLPCPEPRLFLDDVAEQLLLWTEGDRRSARPLEKIRQLVAPARATICALKAELQPEQKQEEVKDVKELSLKIKKKKFPRLPWLDHYSLRPNPLPLSLR